MSARGNIPAILIAGALLVAHVLFCLKAQPLNADLLYFESLYHDLVVFGRPLAGFFFTEVTFAFPDLLLYLGLRGLVDNPGTAITLYIVLFSAAYFTLLALNFRKLWPARPGLFVLALATLVAVSAFSSGLMPIAYWPNYHGALQLAFLYFLWQGSRRQGGVAILVNAGLAALLGFSDMLAFPAVLLPALMFFGRRAWRERRRDFSFASAALGLGALIGYAAKVYALRSGAMLGVPFELDGSSAVVASLQAFPRSLPLIIFRNWILFALFSVLAVTAKISRGRSAFKVMALASLGFGIGALLCAGRFTSVSDDVRYLQQLLYLPLLWIFFYGVPARAVSERRACIKAAVGALVLLLLAGLKSSDGSTLAYPRLTACLDQGVKELPSPWGLASFYNAKLITFTSKTQLHLNQVKKNLSFDPWMNSFAWLQNDIYGRPISAHNFFVARDRAQGALARAIWGPPRRSFFCATPLNDVEVLIYPNGITPLPVDSSLPN